jgi:hypothetical protein
VKIRLASPCGVSIRGTGKQPGTTDELYGHDAGACHAVALRMDGRAQVVAEGDRRTIAAAQVAAVISSPLWGVSHVALRGFELRGGRVILSGVYDAPEAMSRT